jgi:DNA-binding response OmpR family regulator
VRVLIVEDDRKMADLIRRGLEESGHSARVAHDGVSGLDAANSIAPETIVLDVMLPGIDGFEFTRRLRKGGNPTPILMLTGRDSVADVVQGLNLGADDYVTKPFSLKILIARLEALARRSLVAMPERLQIADLILDLETHEVRRSGVKVALTKTEFDILSMLMRRASRVVTRDALIDEVWGLDRSIESNTLDAFIRLLRGKLDADPSRRLIHTIRGVGYSLREEGWRENS